MNFKLLLLPICLLWCFSLHADVGDSVLDEKTHPRLLLSPSKVKEMKAGIDSYPLFSKSVQASKNWVGKSLHRPINVPQPKDPGGGFTHEQHKRNFRLIREAGLLYQLTNDKTYADFVKKLLIAYADLYPGLPEHPAKKEESPGRLFWQSLNEAMWLVNSIQGYDAVIETFSKSERKHIEANLFIPMASFLSDQSPQTFDRIHNHGTWANAAVGMTGYVLGDELLVKKALLGLDLSGKAGFFKHLDSLFSPDGYYNEGPYYQRFALMPFILFAAAIENNNPEKKIFEYRDGILTKAVNAIIQMSYNGLFFPLNDAIKDKGLTTVELKYAIGIVYDLNPDAGLLSIAQYQGEVDLAPGGVKLARDIHNAKKINPFPFKTMSLSDGANADRGALHIIRSGSEPGHQALVVKNTSQGKVHGHFDKLTWQFYDNGNEIVSDYGAARFLNVEAKYGGHYLPENDLWAKQTVSHNTLVVDETSHFNANLALSEQHSPNITYFVNEPNIAISAASMTGAHPDVVFSRKMAMLTIPEFEYPLVFDLLQANGDKAHRYDLPMYYNGHLIDTNFDLSANTHKLQPLGKNAGYEYLWLRSESDVGQDLARITWLLDDRFYSHSSVTNKDRNLSFVQVGANDPSFNLRHEKGVIARSEKTKQMSFISVLEPHGEYNPSAEFTLNSHSRIKSLQLFEGDTADIIQFSDVDGKVWRLGLARELNSGEVSSSKSKHKVIVQNARLEDELVEWEGSYYFK